MDDLVLTEFCLLDLPVSPTVIVLLIGWLVWIFHCFFYRVLPHLIAFLDVSQFLWFQLGFHKFLPSLTGFDRTSLGLPGSLTVIIRYIDWFVLIIHVIYRVFTAFLLDSTLVFQWLTVFTWIQEVSSQFKPRIVTRFIGWFLLISLEFLTLIDWR